jgi:hypothetical protein
MRVKESFMKRSFIMVLLVLLVCVGAVGFYRGWFTLSSRNLDAGSNKVNINLTVDRDKIQEDAETVKNKATELTGQATEEVNGPGDLASDKVQSTDP